MSGAPIVLAYHPTRAMALIKTRPKIRLRVPNEIRPGEMFDTVVLLDCRREVEVQHVDVVLEATESIVASSSSDTRAPRRTLLNLGARLCAERLLDRGETALALRIPLPDNAPPSYRGRAARIDYELRVHVALQWWPDSRAAFEIDVVPPKVESPPVVPGLYSSDPNGPRAKEAHAELSLASQWTRAGDIVSGAFALSNVRDNRYSEVKVGLVGIEKYFDTEQQHESMRYRTRVSADAALEGEMIPFRFRVPDDAVPDIARANRPDGRPGLFELRWFFELTVGVRWGSDLTLRVPFRVLPPSSLPGDAPMRLAPPTIGSDRMRAVWEQAGREHALRFDAHGLFGRFGETALKISRDHQGRGGVHLVAEIRYPELHLDLSVEPASAVRKVIGGGVRVGHEAWDREHFVVARDAKQAATLLDALVPALSGARVRRFDDRLLTLELRDSGLSYSHLSHFVAAAIRLAGRLDALRRELPPPDAMADALDAWRTLARILGAELETARMRVEGELAGLAAEARVAFDAQGQPSSTWLSVRPPSPLDAAHSFVWRSEEGSSRDAIAARFGGEVGELMAVVCADAAEITLEPERVMLCMPELLGLSSSFTAKAAERRLERMAQLTNVLRGHAGPYR